MNNSVFGKTIENTRKSVDIKLANDKRKAEKLVAKPNFKHLIIFHDRGANNASFNHEFDSQSDQISLFILITFSFSVVSVHCLKNVNMENVCISLTLEHGQMPILSLSGVSLLVKNNL